MLAALIFSWSHLGLYSIHPLICWLTSGIWVHESFVKCLCKLKQFLASCEYVSVCDVMVGQKRASVRDSLVWNRVRRRLQDVNAHPHSIFLGVPPSCKAWGKGPFTPFVNFPWKPRGSHHIFENPAPVNSQENILFMTTWKCWKDNSIQPVCLQLLFRLTGTYWTHYL